MDTNKRQELIKEIIRQELLTISENDLFAFYKEVREFVLGQRIVEDDTLLLLAQDLGITFIP